MSKDPLILRAIIIAVIARPIRQSVIFILWKLPIPIFHSKNFSVAIPPDLVTASTVGGISEVPTTMISASFNPMMVMNRPIPTVIARLRELGTAITRI